MHKSRYVAAVLAGLLLIAGIYTFWPSSPNKSSSQPPQLSKEEVPLAVSSEPRPAPPPLHDPVAIPTSNEIGVITGEVFALDGTRVADAEVSLRRMNSDFLTGSKRVDEPALTAPTDVSGHFVVNGLALGTYVVSVHSGDRYGAVAISIARDWPTGHVVIVLRKDALGLAGTVVDSDNAPIEGARVALVIQDGEDLRDSMDAFWEVETDNTGTFSFHCLEPGIWQAYVTAAHYAPLLTNEMKAGDTGVRIVLTQGGSAGGSAVWAENNLPAAGVVLKAQFKGVSRTQLATATVEPSGRFTFERLIPGEHEILPEDKTLVPVDNAIRVEVVEGKPITDLQVRIAKGGIVRGRVFDANTQEGIAGVRVTARAEDAAAALQGRYSEPTDESGNYEISGLSASGYILDTYSSNGYRTQFADVNALKFEITPGAVLEDKDIPMSRGVNVAGLVIEGEGNPAPYAKVTGRSPGVWQWPETYTDDSGRFAFWEFSAGDAIYLRAEGAGHRSELEGPITIPAGGISDLQITLTEQCDAAIAGTVIDPSGNPVAALVICNAVGADPNADENARRFEKTSSDGTFLIAGLTAGDYKLGLGPGHSDFLREVISAMSVHLDPGQVRAGLRLVYDDSKITKISGRVTDSDGNPIEFADIMLTGPDGNGLPAMIKTNKDGDYTVIEVGTDLVTVRASHPQYVDQYREGVAPNTANVDFVLPNPGRISGQVIDAATGQPLQTYDITEHPNHMPRSFRKINDSEGRFSFSITGQIHDLMLRAPGYVMKKHRIRPSIEPGESRDDIVIELTAGEDSSEIPQHLPSTPPTQP